MTAAAYEDAATLLQRALAVAQPPIGPRRRCELLCALGDVLDRAGQRERARRSFDDAAELARRIGDGELLARAALGAAGVGVTILAVDHVVVERLEEALAVLDDEHPLLPLVLARLAIELAYDPDDARRETAAAEAIERARQLGDPVALATALNAQHVTHWGPDHTNARLDGATEMLDAARRAGNRELALQARHWRVVDLLELGDGARVQAELDAYAALAAQVRLPGYTWYVPMWRATVALLAGRISEAAELARRARDLGRRAGDANADTCWREHRHARWVAEERYDEWDEQEIARSAEKIMRSRAGRAYAAGLASVLAQLGRRAEAHQMLDRAAAGGFEAVPRDTNWLSAMALAAEACAVLDDRERAESLRALLEPFVDRMVIAARGCFHFGSAAYALARLAVTLGDHESADALYAEAVRRDERAGATIWVVRDLRRHAEALRARGELLRAADLSERATKCIEAAGRDTAATAHHAPRAGPTTGGVPTRDSN
jgi:tetratricopeptide (TPR) repeat protein